MREEKKMNLIPWRRKQKQSLTPMPVERATSLVPGMMEEMMRGFFEDPFGFRMPRMFPGLLAGGALRGPAVDVEETPEEVVVRAEVPGVPAEDIQVSLNGDLLTITAETESHRQPRFFRRGPEEHRYFALHETIRLPAAVREEAAEAECKDGVLTVRLPKVAPEILKRIPVRTG